MQRYLNFRQRQTELQSLDYRVQRTYKTDAVQNSAVRWEYRSGSAARATDAGRSAAWGERLI